MAIKTGDIISGFRVDRIRTNEGAGGTLYEMTHIKSGAELAWLENSDTNKHFGITFKTPPTDDTGVFHILEHSVLNGSRKYTVKEPFLELIKSSMNTFLNAMTSSDFTIYPVSSRNEQDFINLMNVYLDGVFFPAIHTNPNIFYQEGWHTEILQEDDIPTYKGVVYNEMKGAVASPDRQLHSGISALMYPDTCYRFNSGGEPAAIPSLTYDAFKRAHKKFYHPGNSKIYLDGDIDIEKILSVIDGDYLSAFDRNEEVIEIPLQEPVRGVRKEGFYQAENSEHAYLSFGRVMCNFDDVVKRFAIIVLSDYLAENNESPLNKAVLASDIAQDFYAFFDQSTECPSLVFTAKHIDMEREDEFWAAIAGVKEEIRKKGVDRNEISAILSQLEYALKDADEPKGLNRNIAALSTWLYCGDPMDMLDLGKVFAKLRELSETDYFDRVFDEIPLTPEECAVYVMRPSATKDAETLEKEKAALEAESEARTPEETQALLELNRNLAVWQKTDDTPEDLATLPTLPLSAVNTEPYGLHTEVRDGIIFHETPDDGIIRVNLYFSLTGTDPADYMAMSLLTNLLGELPTKSYSVTELRLRMKSTVGYADYNAAAYTKLGEPGKCHPYFVVTFGVLSHKLDEAIKLISEIVNETDFEAESTRNHVEDILVQCFYYMQDSIASEGHRFARGRASSHVSAVALIDDMMTGLGMYEWMRDFLKDFDGNYKKLISDLTRLRDSVFNADNMIVSVAASDVPDGISAIRKMFDKGNPACGVARASSEAPESGVEQLRGEAPEFISMELDKVVRSEAVVVPGGISYSALVSSTADCGAKPSGRAYALTMILSYQYLWNEVRVKRGAYGCGFGMTRGGMIRYYSYRDPSPAESLEVYAHSSDFLKAYCESDDNFDNIIISAAAQLEPLMNTSRAHKIADLEHFMGITMDDKRQTKKELVEMKKSDLLDFCDMLDNVPKNGYSCVVCSAAHIDEIKADKVYDLTQKQL